MKSKSKPTKRHAQNRLRSRSVEQKLPFQEHIRELRRRSFYVLLCVTVFAAASYAVQAHLINWLLQPTGNQQFIYTTPGGGFDFQFKLCLYAGLAASIPVLIYQVFHYINPLLRYESRRFIRRVTLSSSLLALGGILFGYFVGLPAAMHFLLQSFSGEQIRALITIQSYMNFVLVYLLGAALLFQIPLILLLINRMKPLKPGTLMKQQRWFIIGAFVIGAIISPTPDIRNQLLLTGPIILMYQLGIMLVWFVNRSQRKSRKVIELLHRDLETQSQRLARLKTARTIQAAQPEPSTGAYMAMSEAAALAPPKQSQQRSSLPILLPRERSDSHKV